MWKYTFDKPSSLWNITGFDDSHWQEGPGGFGTAFTRGARVHTKWDSADIWLRKSFVLGEDNLLNVKFFLHHDKSVEVYINGVPALATEGYLVDYALFDIAPEALRTLHSGTNYIAVHCNQTSGGQFVDVGIVTLASPAADPHKSP